MSTSNQELIEKFYAAFAKGDAATMTSLYAKDAIFSDPVFGTLKGQDITDMWTMLIKRSRGNMSIKFGEIIADGNEVSTDWVASYPYGAKGRPVINFVHADFLIREGKIVEHHDDFDLWQWSRQALGLMGTLLGWSSYVQNKIKDTGTNLLASYQKNK